MKNNNKNSVRAVTSLLFLVAFVSYANNLMVAPLLKPMAASLNSQVVHLGFLVAVYGLIAGSISLVTGPFSDRFGRKRTIVLFALLSSVTTALFAFSWSLTSLYVFRVLNAMATGPLLACALAAVGDYFQPEQRGRAIGHITSAIFMSTIIGVPVGLVLSQVGADGWRVAFAAVAGLALVTMTGAALLLKPVPKPASQMTVVAILRGYVELLRDSNIAKLIAAFGLIYVANGLFITYYPAYLMSNRELTGNGLAAVYTVGGVFAYCASLAAGRLCDRYSRHSIALLATAIIATAMIVILHVPTTAQTIMAAVMVISVCYMSAEAFRQTSLQTEAVNLVGAQRRGTFMGVLAFVIAAGTSLGAATGGFLLQYFKAAATEPVAAGQLVGYEYTTYLAVGLIGLSWLLLKSCLAAPQGEISPARG